MPMHVSFKPEHAVFTQSNLPKSPYPYLNMQLPTLPTIVEDTHSKQSAESSPDYLEEGFLQNIIDYYNPSDNSSEG
jgi:hypothetical protein